MKGRPFILLGLFLFAVGVAAWRPIPVGVWHDDGVYMLVAKALAEGQGLVYSGVVGSPPAAKFPPLYPFVLAGLWSLFSSIGAVTMAATFLNLALLAGAGALFGLALTRSTDLGLRAAVALSALAFASSDVLRPALIPLSESLFLLLTTGALACWPRVDDGDRAGIVLAAALLLGGIATRTAGLALVLAYGVALLLRRRAGTAAAVTAPALIFLVGWGWWSRRAAEAIPENARDLLGPYGGWITQQALAAPGSFVDNLPRHALGLGESVVAMTFPGVVGAPIWVLGALMAPLVAVGLLALVKRFPPLGWFGVVYLGVLLVWPYLDRRLIVPWFPVVLTALVLGVWTASERIGGEKPKKVALGMGALWVLAYATFTAGRIAEGWPTDAYRLRADRLAAAVEALSRTAPPDAVVGAPEYWAALHLHGGWSVAPSVRFDPRRADPDEPMWGTVDEQLDLWRSLGVDHLLLEQNGVLHSDALDAVEEACPGAVVVLARMPSQMVVRVDLSEVCATTARALSAGHDEERLALEGPVVGSESIRVVELRDVDRLGAPEHHVDGDRVVHTVANADEEPASTLLDEIEGQVAESHGNDGVQGIGIP